MRTQMRAIGFVAALALAGMGILRAKAQEPAKPGPEMEKLGFLVGTWNVVSKYEKTPLFPNGGEAKGTYAGKWGPGRFSVVADFGATGGPEGAIQGHEVITWDEKAKAYKQFIFGNNFPGAFQATGRWEGEKLVFEGELEFGGTLMRFRNEATTDADGSVTMRESYSAGDSPRVLMITTRGVKTGRAEK